VKWLRVFASQSRLGAAISRESSSHAILNSEKKFVELDMESFCVIMAFLQSVRWT